MKVLLQFGTPFSFAHGGAQVQMEETKKGLEAAGAEVEFLRWWDEKQRGDVIHCFERSNRNYIAMAQRQGMKVVIAPLLTGPGSRPHYIHFIQRQITALGRRFLPEMISVPFGWESFLLADGCVALTAWEAQLMSYLFRAPPQRVHVVPNGVEEVFLQSGPSSRGKWLVCTATVTGRKRVVELAQAAIAARTPVWIIGKPYSEQDPYAKRFLAEAAAHPDLIRYEGAVNDRQKLATIYREARGFVLLSAMESLSLSAMEAAACECPLLLSDLPWARCSFPSGVSFCPVTDSAAIAGAELRRFYDAAPHLPPPPKPHGWPDIGRRLIGVYQSLLRPSQ